MRITDGWGWRKAKKNLQEAYIEIPYLFGAADMEEGLFKTLGPLMFLLWQKIVRRGIKKPPPHAKEQRRVKRRRISREQGGRISFFECRPSILRRKLVLPSLPSFSLFSP